MKDSSYQNQGRAEERAALLAAYKKVFGSAEGKRVLANLRAAHFVDSGLFNEVPGVMAHNEGQRSVVLRILHILQDKQDNKENVCE